jgi:hypothetical protein
VRRLTSPFFAFIIAIAVATASSCSAKPVAVTATVLAVDDSIFQSKVIEAKHEGIDLLSIGDAVAASGKLFLHTPYVAGTLDRDSVSENLVVDLHEFDCVTFYENALAFARTLKLYRSPTLADFEKQVTLLRYRGGVRDGFGSRLHYSTDYFADAAQKAVLKLMTAEVGGSLAQKDTRAIDFMTTHRNAYKQLRGSDKNFATIEAMEKSVASRGGYVYIPKADVAVVESKIKSGDILGITTSIHGLDCSHTGIAIRMPDGRVHFMHASSLHHEVIISDEPLADYLTHSNSQTGIIVNRPLEPTHD